MSVKSPSVCFIDTNIWLYAFVKGDDDTKSSAARRLLMTSQPVVSTQIINEVCVNLLRLTDFTESQIQQLIDSFYQKYQVIGLTHIILMRASELRERYSLSFWDSLIVATGLDAGVDILYSEDMQHGLVIERRLRIRNPFTIENLEETP